MLNAISNREKLILPIVLPINLGLNFGMDFNYIQLDSDHKQCIISLINKIVAKSPHLTELKTETVLFTRLVSVISLIETTLCSKYQIALKRNSTDSQSIHLIKSWLKQYYNKQFITYLCREEFKSIELLNDNDEDSVTTEETVTPDSGQTDTTEEKAKEAAIDDNLNVYDKTNIDRDIGLVSLLVLFIAHKLRQSLPRIKAYFSPEWQTLSQFSTVLNRILNFDKLLDLIQNELCIKRKQLEITKSKVNTLQSTLNSRTLEQIKQKKTKHDYRSNLFDEFEDNDCEENKDIIDSDENPEDMSEVSDGSAVFIDHSSDDDYQPKNKTQKIFHKTTAKQTARVSQRATPRGRGRPSKGSTKLCPIKIEKKPPKSVVRTPKSELNTTVSSNDGESEMPFVCDVCGKQFAKEYRLNRHSFTHLGHKQFVCDFPDCNQSFDLKWKLTEHKGEHEGDEEDNSYTSTGHTFECEWADCGLMFSSKRELTAHEHELHAKRSQSKYSCDWPHCREIFENKIDWRKHVKTHGKITPTECGFPGCNKSFYKLDALENHRKVHETFTLEELS